MPGSNGAGSPKAKPLGDDCAAQGVANFSGADWHPRNIIQNSALKKVTEIKNGKKVTIEKQVKDKARELEGRVYALDLPKLESAVNRRRDLMNAMRGHIIAYGELVGRFHR